ncbi:TPA: nucleotide pyrophosphohydrolase [Streptococcus suis]
MKQLITAINQFRDERNWRQFHNEKDLAISISLEACELLEHFQWKTSEEALENQAAIEDELADVFTYAIMLADNLGCDIEEIILRKLDKNAEKYPIEKSFGNKQKYTELD